MDHHCNFIGNCIGHANKKYFILLLIYIMIMVFFVAFIIFPLGFYATLHPKKGPFFHWIFRVFDFIQLALGIYIVIVVNLVLPQQLRGVLCNITTIETVGRKEFFFFSNSQTRRFNKYDLGMVKNVQKVFGTSVWKALLPINTYRPEDFLTFEYNNECADQNHLEIEDYEF